MRSQFVIPVIASILILGTILVSISFDDAFAKQEKVTICHKPGTVDEETKEIPVSALNGHLGHGDAEGDCIVAENRPPTISTILITPTLPFTTDNLFCDVVGMDLDGDPVSFSYEWKINTVLDVTELTSTYPSSKFTKGDVVECTVTPNDGIEDGTSDSSFVTIQNSAPIADDQNIITNVDTSIAIILSGSDSDADPMTFTITSNPTNGVLSVSASSPTYTPDLGFSGSDSFTFQIFDGITSSNIATVSITVNP